MTRAQLRDRMKRLRADLEYRQTMNRVEARGLRNGIAAAKRIGAEMRSIQRLLEKK